jgi:hypothetical protein
MTWLIMPWFLVITGVIFVSKAMPLFISLDRALASVTRGITCR